MEKLIIRVILYGYLFLLEVRIIRKNPVFSGEELQKKLLNKTIFLKRRPKGKPALDDFEIRKAEKPVVKEGEILLKSIYVSVDPYLRGRMRDEKSYIEPFKLEEPSNEKIQAITTKQNLDEGINYKSSDNLKAAVKNACPNGVDVYFDNVGGEILDAALANINKFGRVINCGAISQYNNTEVPMGPRPEGILIKKSVLMQGFTVRDYLKDFGPAIKQLATWLQEDKLKYSETVVEGFDNIPQAFLDLFEGKNKGKLVVKI